MTLVNVYSGIRLQGDAITNQSVAEIMFDWFWGSGYPGLKWEQGVLATVFNMALKVDFRIDNFEVDIINDFPDQAGPNL